MQKKTVNILHFIILNVALDAFSFLKKKKKRSVSLLNFLVRDVETIGKLISLET